MSVVVETKHAVCQAGRGITLVRREGGMFIKPSWFISQINGMNVSQPDYFLGTEGYFSDKADVVTRCARCRDNPQRVCDLRTIYFEKLGEQKEEDEQ